MKIFALVVVLCVSGALADITTDQVMRLLRYKDECMGETGIGDEMLDKAMKDGSTYEREEKLECFMACILKKVGIMNQDGSINVVVAKEHAPAGVPTETIDDMITTCKDAGGDTECKKAANFVDCLLEKQLQSSVKT